MTANTRRHALGAICAKQSKVPAWACEAGLGKVWDDVALKDCAVSFESAQRVAVCPVLEDSATKQEKVSAACSLQSRVSADTCEAGLGKMWEVVTAAECTGEVTESARAQSYFLVSGKAAIYLHGLLLNI